MIFFRFMIPVACAVPLLGLLMSCEQEIKPEAATTPGPTYTGPAFLRTTIRSMCELRGFEPKWVSGYGLVVNLKDTGSSDCPPEIREWLINEMGKKGFGLPSLGFENLTPEQVLNSDRTSVVRIDGLIPSGSPSGADFDLLVSALPQTQTTSLAEGLLYTTDLRVDGANIDLPAGFTLAKGKGPVTISPSLNVEAADPSERLRVGRVLAGGSVTESMKLELVLHQPSYLRTQQIANRINERFPPSSADKFPIANATNDSTVEITVIEQFKKNPQRMLDLISHLYLDGTNAFNQEQAKVLSEVLLDPLNHRYADDIAYCWEGMGRTVIPLLQDLYTQNDPVVRLTALQAGARLGDPKSGDGLIELTGFKNAREQATSLLGELLTTRPDHGKVRKMLRQLINDENPRVRLAAADALAETQDDMVQRWAFDNKMELARIETDKPLVWAAQSGKPRILIFDSQLRAKEASMFSIWDNQLMLKTDRQAPNRLEIYYRDPYRPEPVKASIDNNATMLVGMLAYRPDADSKTPGLDLSYAQVVEALEKMSREGFLPATFQLESSELAKEISRRRITETDPDRPDTDRKEKTKPLTFGP